jgi:hypothetical protein
LWTERNSTKSDTGRHFTTIKGVGISRYYRRKRILMLSGGDVFYEYSS